MFSDDIFGESPAGGRKMVTYYFPRIIFGEWNIIFLMFLPVLQ